VPAAVEGHSTQQKHRALAQACSAAAMGACPLRANFWRSLVLLGGEVVVQLYGNGNAKYASRRLCLQIYDLLTHHYVEDDDNMFRCGAFIALAVEFGELSDRAYLLSSEAGNDIRPAPRRLERLTSRRRPRRSARSRLHGGVIVNRAGRPTCARRAASRGLAPL
jgi:hypothetical protein